jgi:heme-degrading monooxygenase HmoA
MEAAVRRIDGYISHFGFRDAQTRQGVTISYFETQESIDQWREVPDHLEAQALGREYFYDDYTVHIAHIERGYTWNRSDGYSSELT